MLDAFSRWLGLLKIILSFDDIVLAIRDRIGNRPKLSRRAAKIRCAQYRVVCAGATLDHARPIETSDIKASRADGFGAFAVHSVEWYQNRKNDDGQGAENLEAHA